MGENIILTPVHGHHCVQRVGQKEVEDENLPWWTLIRIINSRQVWIIIFWEIAEEQTKQCVECKLRLLTFLNFCGLVALHLTDLLIRHQTLTTFCLWNDLHIVICGIDSLIQYML